MKPEYIIIHHSLTEDSGTVSWQAIRRYHVKELGWRDVGYHLGVELVNGTPEVLLGRWFTEVGAHTVGMNSKSIGICVVGNFDEDVQVARMISDGRFETLIRVTNQVASMFNIPAARVYPHRQFAPNKSCPGKLFPWTAFIDAVGG